VGQQNDLRAALYDPLLYECANRGTPRLVQNDITRSRGSRAEKCITLSPRSRSGPSEAKPGEPTRYPILDNPQLATAESVDAKLNELVSRHHRQRSEPLIRQLLL
jgi:hypothetical protein